MKLDIGAGAKREEGFLATDIAGQPDVRCDARFLPFRGGAFEGIKCHHVLEHIERRDLVGVMNEAHRVLKPGGAIDIEMPVFPFWTAMADPTHVSFYVPQTWDYFSNVAQYGEQMALYGIRPWKLMARKRLSDGQIMRVLMEKPEEAA
jgi:predicted SAM-dependent methyltransferase